MASYCLEPNCPDPVRDRQETEFCRACGARLSLNDRYRAVRLLGAGGYGRTFAAVDTSRNNQLVAIKQLAVRTPKLDDAALTGFDTEAAHLQALGQHPQIPELIDYFAIAGRPYLIQAYIDGQNLQQELAIDGKFSQQQIRELLLSLLPVLEFLHTQSPPVIHRDLKPANIIRRRSDARLFLVDFGAAKSATQSDLTATIVGSPEYTAPEQLRGKPSVASDIYSLGVTCLHLLTQVSPFDLFDVVEDRWMWRDFLGNNSVSAELGRILDRAIANALSHRYRAAAEMLAALTSNTVTVAPIARTRDYLAINIDRQIGKPQSARARDREPQTFWFETARLIPDRTLWGTRQLTLVKQRGQAERWFEDLGGGIRLQMVNIPAGYFFTDTSTETADLEEERGYIAAFAVGKYPVTQAQYAAITGERPAHFHGGDRPVEMVSWDEAIDFCRKLSQLTGKNYRLPTEVEWEYAARAETTTRFCFGDEIERRVANFQQQETTVPGIFPANDWGLYDLHGNVLEWCADTDLDPQIRILRGGSWRDRAIDCSSSARTYFSPDTRTAFIGLRLACNYDTTIGCGDVRIE